MESWQIVARDRDLPAPVRVDPDTGFGDGGRGGLGTLSEPTTDYKPEHGDHERFAHYVLKDKILESAFSGDPVIALCGKVWIPNRDPSRFPVCPECAELYEMDPADRAREINRRSGGGGEE